MQPSQPYDSGNPEQVKAKKNKAQVAREREIGDMRVVLSTLEGRRFVWRQLSLAGVFSDTTSTEPHAIGRFLGRRAQGLALLSEIIRECPKEYLLMQEEAMKKEKEDQTNE